MKLKKYVWIIGIFIILSQVSATSNIIIPLETFDTLASSQINWVINVNDSIVNGMLYGVGGKNMNLNESRLVHNLTKNMGWTLPTPQRNNLTVCFDLNLSDNAPGDIAFTLDNSNATTAQYGYMDIRGGSSSSRYAWNDQTRTTDWLYGRGVWQKACVYFNWSQGAKLVYNLYLNGTFVANFSDKKSTNGASTPDIFRLARAQGVSMWMDNFTACNSTPVNLNCSVSSISITLNTTNPRQGGVVNASISVTEAEYNLANGTIIENSTGANRFYNFTLNNKIEQFSQNFTISCGEGCIVNITGRTNNTGSGLQQTSQLITIAGTTAPTILINGENFFNSINSTFIALSKLVNQRLYINFTDNIDLFAFNITIFNASGDSVYNITNTSLSGTFGNFSQMINIKNGSGRYNVSIVAWDSHTDYFIPEYDTRTNINSITYDNRVTISSPDAIAASTTKKSDRYTMKFTYSSSSTPTTKTFILESDAELIPVYTSGYKAHFVDWKNKKWVDFEGISGQPTLTQLRSNKWQISFDNADTEVNLQSIGGLNRNENWFSFDAVETKSSFSSPLDNSNFTGSQINVTVLVNGTYLNRTSLNVYDESYILRYSYNKTFQANGSYFYNFTLNGTTSNKYYLNTTHYDLDGGTSNATISINRVLLTINLSIYDEFFGKPTFITGTNVSLEIVAPDQVINISTTTGGILVNLSSSYEYRISYSADKYRIRRYYFKANNLNGTIDLYLLSIGNGTLTTFTITDQNANFADSLNLIAQRYYYQSNTYETVAIAKTDSKGEAVIDLQSYVPFYKFVITEEDGTILLTTVPNNVFSTSYDLKVNTEGDSYSTITTRGSINTPITFSNTSQSFTMTYVNPDGVGGSQTCLIVSTISLKNGQTQVCNSCSSSASATLVCSASTYYNLNNTIIAKGFAYGTSSNNSAILLDELVIQPAPITTQIKSIFGQVGIFLGIMIILAMILLGLWNPLVALVLGTFGFVMVYVLGIMSLGTSGIQWVVSIVILAGILIYRSRA